MKIYPGTSHVKLKKAVVTIGNFDGVHLGHQKIFKRVIQRCKKIGGTSVVFTFYPHPLKVLDPKRVPPSLTTFEEKIKLIESIGIEVLIYERFTKRFANQSPLEFIENILHNRVHACEILVGQDYAFGKNREGSVEILKELSKQYNYRLWIIKNVVVDGIPVRSTSIRNLIQQGDVKTAGRLLGRPYTIEGKVIRGYKRQIGFPTANIKPPQKLIPKDGVYVGWVNTQKGKFPSVINIGLNPTFGNKQRSIEAHILNFEGNLYGKSIRIEFVERLRDEKKFRSVRSLVNQIEKDIKEATLILGRKPEK